MGLRALAALGPFYGYQDSSNSERRLECGSHRKVDLPTYPDASLVNGWGGLRPVPAHQQVYEACEGSSASALEPRLLSLDRCQSWLNNSTTLTN